MSGLLRRIRRTRPAAAEESRTQLPALSEPQDATTTAEPSGGGTPLAGLRDLPAGLEPEELRSPRPATERRARVRRRARYLRRVRELLLRDLGGLVYEIHRADGGDKAHQERLVQAKAQRLAALDAELHALEARLGSAHPETVLREPGIGGVCPACGELHGSEARFCSACGQPLTPDAPGREPANAPTAPTEPAHTARASEADAAPPGAQGDAHVAHAPTARASEAHEDPPGAQGDAHVAHPPTARASEADAAPPGAQGDAHAAHPPAGSASESAAEVDGQFGHPTGDDAPTVAQPPGRQPADRAERFAGNGQHLAPAERRS